MLTLDNLPEIFEEEKAPFWRLFDGRTTRGAKRGENLKEEDLGASCDLLIRRLELYGAGTFTVAMSDNANFQNARAVQHTIKLDGTSATVSGVTSSTVVGNQFQQMQDMFAFVQQLNNREAEGIGSVVDSELERFKMQMEVARLKSELTLAKRGTPIDRIVEGLVARSPQLLDRVLGTQQRGVAGTRGFEEPNPQLSQDASVTYDPDDAPGEQQEEAEQHAFSMDQAIAAIQQIATALPHHHPNELLWKLANYINNDPVQAETLIAML